MQEVCARPRQYKSYAHNRNRDMVELLPEDMIERAQEPGLLYAKSCLENASQQPAALGIKKQEV